MTVPHILRDGVGALSRQDLDENFASASSYVNAVGYLNPLEYLQVVSRGSALDLTASVQRALDSNKNKIVYFPSGVWSVTTIDLRGNYGGIVGDSANPNFGTEFRSRSASVLFNIDEVADTPNSPYYLSKFFANGNGVGTIGVKSRYRHNASKEDLLIYNFTSKGIEEKDTYTCTNRNLRVFGNAINVHLVGSNHGSSFYACVIDSGVNGCLLIQSLGTPLDGNDSLLFSACVIQSGAGYGADIDASSVVFSGCYLGENQTGPIIRQRSGNTAVVGGKIFFGFAATSYAVDPVGGVVTVCDNCQVGGQTFSGIAMLSGPSTGGKVSYQNIDFQGTIAGSPVISGDVIDYGPQGTVYAERLGKNWTGEGNAITFSSALVGNAQLLTVLTAPGPTPLLGARSALVNNTKWRDGEQLYCVVVYESSKALNVSLSGGAFGGLPLTSVAAGLPATSGTPNTAVLLNCIASNSAYTLLELIQNSSAVNDTLKIYEVFLCDSRMLNRRGGVCGNLFKC